MGLRKFLRTIREFREENHIRQLATLQRQAEIEKLKTEVAIEKDKRPKVSPLGFSVNEDAIKCKRIKFNE